MIASARDIAILLTAVTLAVALVVLNFPRHAAPLTTVFSPEQVESMQAVDVTAQRQAHRVALVCIVLFAAVGALGWKRAAASRTVRRLSGMARPLKRQGGILVAVALLFFVITHPSDRSVPALFCAVGAFVVLWLLPFFRTRVDVKVLIAFLVIDVLFLMLPGLLETPDFSGEKSAFIAQVGHHFSIVVGAADRLAMGRAWFDGAAPYYGLLPPAALAAVQLHFRRLDFGEHIRLMQLLQLAFLVLAALSYYLWKPRAPLLWIAPLLVLLPWLGTNFNAVLFPNQSAWRSLGFPVATLALLLSRRVSLVRAAMILGFATTLVLLLNTETGICVTLGTIVFLAVRIETPLLRYAASIAAAFAIGAAVVLGLFWLLLGVGLGDWALLPKLTGMVQLFRRYGEQGSNLRGLALSLDPVALLIFLHATFVALHAALRRSDGALSFGGAFRAAISAITLVWFAYYVARPHEWNLWTLYFLYGFLLAPLLEGRLWNLFRKQWRRGFVPLPIAVLTLALAPVTVLAHANANNGVLDRLPFLHPRGAAVLRSGVWLSPTVAAALEEKATLLRSLNRPVYFTNDCYLLPLLTGLDNQLPDQDVFAGTFTPADFEALAKTTLALGPPQILFDDPHTEGAGPAEVQAFFARLGRRLSPHYRPARIEHGWQIWERK